MTTPIEQIAALSVGLVESVSPGEVKVLLDLDAPQDTALNAGTPTRFPRLNGYVLIPNETGAVVGLISWLGVERSSFPKRTGLKDFGLIDLPFPLRTMTIVPVGTLRTDQRRDGEEDSLVLERGIASFPSVGDPVLLPTDAQLQAIVQARGRDRRILLGLSPLASGAPVHVDPDKIFGRHLAVLGNTGSGKSCSVAGLVRWAMSAATGNLKAGDSPNARFIVLDPNGEYSEAFKDLPSATRLFRVDGDPKAGKTLTVPAWMWNSREWSAFSLAQPAVQRPLLIRALRELRAGGKTSDDPARAAARMIRQYRSRLDAFLSSGLVAFQEFPGTERVGQLLALLVEDAGKHAGSLEGDAAERFSTVATEAHTISERRRWESKARKGWNAFSQAELTDLRDRINAAAAAMPEPPKDVIQSEDAPLYFDVHTLADHLEFLGRESESGQYVSNLVMRIRALLSDTRLRTVIAPEEATTVPAWLESMLGNDTSGAVTIIDLSLIPSDVIHLIVAVIARLVFETLQRYRRTVGTELPTVMVLEEAHAFVTKGSDSDEGVPSPTQMCRQTFERIAREGRKFGLGLVLSSQRPSELSQTVLAQCNTFLLHRIVNDRDQELIGRLVPDDLRGLLKELPSLPTRLAVLLGWATPVPMLVEVRELPEHQQPRSQDPNFWKTWTREVERPTAWADVVGDWTQ